MKPMIEIKTLLELQRIADDMLYTAKAFSAIILYLLGDKSGDLSADDKAHLQGIIDDNAKEELLGYLGFWAEDAQALANKAKTIIEEAK